MRPAVPTILLLAAAATACGPCGFQPDPGVKVVVPGMPTTLDWNTSHPNSWVNYPVMLATQRGLTSLTPGDNRLAPGLAERWERRLTPEGHEVYTFHLRHDVKWSDGATPLTAEDFVVGWRRSVLGKERGEISEVLGAHEIIDLLDQGAPPDQVAAAVERFGVRALDPLTLEVTLEHPRSYFLARLSNVYLYFPAPSPDLRGKSEEEILEYYDRPRNGRPMSLGPFRVDSWDRAGERVRLVRNPASAFQPPLGPGERVPEAVTLMKSEIGPALYERDRVGFVFVDRAIALRGPPAPDLRREELLSTYFLAFNTERPPLNRPEVRRALAMALDRDALLQGLLPAARPTTVFLPPSLPAAAMPEEAARLPHFDLEGARALLAKAGGVQRPLRLVHTSNESFIPEVAIAERVKAQLARVGVQVEIDARSDFSSEIARIAQDGFRAHDMYLKRVGADYAHPKTFFVFFERSGNHFTGWDKAEGGAAISRFEALLEHGDAEEDPDRARASYAQAQELLLGEQAVIVPIYHPDRYFRLKPELVGLHVDPFNFLSLRDLRVRSVPEAPR